MGLSCTEAREPERVHRDGNLHKRAAKIENRARLRDSVETLDPRQENHDALSGDPGAKRADQSERRISCLKLQNLRQSEPLPALQPSDQKPKDQHGAEERPAPYNLPDGKPRDGPKLNADIACYDHTEEIDGAYQR